MKYPITAAADGHALRWPSIDASAALAEAWRFLVRNWGLLAALAITFGVHAPTLRYYFDGDDFVVLGDLGYRGPIAYVIDTARMHDLVPNWRPLTGLVYASEWQLFGMDAFWWRLTNLVLHMGSMTVLYALLTRVTRRQGVAAVAALIFGVSGAHFDTVTYITALPHVLATLLVLSSLLALVSYVEDGERNPGAYWLSFALFALAFLANEGAFVFAPLLAVAYALFAKRWRRAPLRLALHVGPFAALAAGWLAAYQTLALKQIKFDDFYWGPHVIGNYAVYASWLAYPVRAIPGDPDALRWALAGVVAAAELVFIVRGPQIARVAVIGVALALLPYVPVEVWTASRYSYAAVAFFAPLAAIAAYAAFDALRGLHRYARLPATLLALVFVATVASLYSWQTYAQDARSGRGTERWRLLATELERNYENVPPGTTIYIVDGLWTNPMWNYTWVPSVARALYGDAAAFDLPRDVYAADPPPPQNALFLEWNGDRLEPVPDLQATLRP